MAKRLLTHGPLLLMALLCEVGLLIYTFAYERQISPVGVFSLWGLAGTGGLTLLIELLKLPLAIHSNGTRGLYRVVVMVFVLLLCGMTFMTVKDLVNNQAILSLAPANALFAEADLLEAGNQSLEDARNRREGDAASARVSFTSTETARDARLETLRTERSAEASLWAQRLATATAGAGVSFTDQAKLDELAAERKQINADADRDFARLDDRLAEEREAHEDHVERVNRDFEARLAAWERECDRRQTSVADREAADASVFTLRLTAFERAMVVFEDSKSRFREERKDVSRELAQRIAAHEEKDGAFYNLAGKVEAEKAWATGEFARIDAASASLVRPKSPRVETKDVIRGEKLPARPVAVNIPAMGPEVGRILAERRTRIERRDAQIAAIDLKISSISDLAIQSSAARSTRTVATVQKIGRERDARMIELDLILAAETGRFDRELAELRAVASTPAETQAFVKASTKSIDANLIAIDTIRYEAVTLREGTEMHRLADFLRPFMPDATWEERAEVAQTAQAIVLAFIAAIAPAFLLKMAMSHVMPHRRTSVPSHRRRRSQGRSQSAGLARLHRRQMEEMARRDAGAAAELKQATCRNDAIEAEACRVAERHAQELAEIRARLVSQIRAAGDDRKTMEAGLQIEGELALSRKQSEITMLEAEVKITQRERDTATNQAEIAVSEVSSRQQELERAAIRRQALRDQQLQDAVEQAERRAHRNADRRVREDVAALRVRIGSLEEEASDLRKDRADLINDNQGQTALIRRHVRTIAEMREELERLGRTLIDVTEGNPGGSAPPKSDDAPDIEIDFDFGDDDVPF